jgi:dipeptidase E
MKLLLTSAGIKNGSIHTALLRLLGKPIAECHALCIPTAAYGHPMAGPAAAWRFVSGREPECPMCELGWQSVGVLELSALPSLGEARWLPWVQQADVFLVGGGDALFLHHWLQQSGLLTHRPLLRDKVWVGLSAGSMVMTPRIGEYFVQWRPPDGDDRTQGWVDFSIFPHVDHPMLPGNTMTHAERWAADIGRPSYAIDDETAIQVVDGAVEVISEGHWQRFNHAADTQRPVR